MGLGQRTALRYTRQIDLGPRPGRRQRRREAGDAGTNDKNARDIRHHGLSKRQPTAVR